MSELQSYRVMIGYASADLEEVISMVPDDVFGKRPVPGANPVSFVYFHVLRHWDRDINIRILSQQPDSDAWHRGGFIERTGYDPTGKGTRGMGTGYGYTEAEVDEVPVNKDALLEYHRVLKSETDKLLDSLDDQTIQGERVLETGGAITTAGRLQHVIAHTYLHIGDIEYIKGLVGARACDVPKIG